MITGQTGPLNFRAQKLLRGRTSVVHVDKLTRNVPDGVDQTCERNVDAPECSPAQESIFYPPDSTSAVEQGADNLSELRKRTNEGMDDSPARRQVLRPRNRLLKPLRFRD